MKNQVRQRVQEGPEEKNDRQERTRIVRKPCDVKIANSKDLRKTFDRYFPDVMLKHGRVTAGGSYVLECEEIAGAIEVEEKWKKEYFGGNSGIVKYNDQKYTAMVKYVYDLDEMSEDEINSDIKANYPDAKYELFKKDDEFTGMIKVTFKDEGRLNTVIQNKFSIAGRKYFTEPFKHKPRVIKCNICQRFGHVARLCRDKDKPVCGKCTKNHETKNCQTNEDEHKCYHCNKRGHITGSYSCEKVQEIYQDLMARAENG